MKEGQSFELSIGIGITRSRVENPNSRGGQYSIRNDIQPTKAERYRDREDIEMTMMRTMGEIHSILNTDGYLPNGRIGEELEY